MSDKEMDYDKRQNTFSNKEGQSSLLGKASRQNPKRGRSGALSSSTTGKQSLSEVLLGIQSSLKSMSDEITVLEVQWQSPPLREAGRKPLPC